MSSSLDRTRHHLVGRHIFLRMAQILDQELAEVDTPGYGQRCLYYAALLSLGMPANEATTKDLKQKVHEKIATILHDMNSHLNRNDLNAPLP